MSSSENAAVVIRSLHRGGAGIVRALAPHFDAPPAEIAARIFRAPAVLATFPEPLAARLVAVLLDAGLAVSLEDPDVALPAQPLHDVAVYVRDAGSLLALAAELAKITGTTLAEAASSLCATPATVLGGVSEATVEAMRARLAPLGAEVDASRTDTARYDVFAVGTDAGALATLHAVLTPLGVEVGPPPLVAADLDHLTAARAWRELGARKLARVVDHAFQRFDVTLEWGPGDPAFVDALVAATGMPAALAPKVLARLPIVVLTGVRRAELDERVAPLVAAGARVRPELVTFRSFAPVVTALGDVDATAELLASIAELPDARARLDRLPAALPPLGDLRARWLQAEVKRLGGRVSLEAR